jgi:hypothetical protein
MMTASEIRLVLNALRKNYARNGEDYALNEVQIAMFTESLAPFDAVAVNEAAKRHMRESKFFPAVSELLALLRGPEMSPEAQAQLAWTTFERALARAGAYNGVTFEDGAIGETVRQVFGGWPQACAFDTHGAAWAIRRQSFLAVYPAIAARARGEVTLRGMAQVAQPLRIAAQSPQDAPGRSIGPANDSIPQGEAVKLLADIRQRASLAGRKAAG